MTYSRCLDTKNKSLTDCLLTDAFAPWLPILVTSINDKFSEMVQTQYQSEHYLARDHHHLAPPPKKNTILLLHAHKGKYHPKEIKCLQSVNLNYSLSIPGVAIFLIKFVLYIGSLMVQILPQPLGSELHYF